MPLLLEIVTPERLAYRDTVDSVNVPGSDGELGILPHHAPLLAMLGVGELRHERRIDVPLDVDPAAIGLFVE